ncbi:MAG TPA: hypothetical protein VFJ04_02160 [Rhodanobacteraceae bacterium]|nr:hypothetical protein [Rhodanobacteraceae bacterium]
MSRSSLFAATLLLFAFAAPHARAADAKPCADAAHHQFDFWIGDWDAFDAAAPGKGPVARNHVDAILGGCALREDYVQADGLHGESFTIYDASRKLWHQSWVTNRGELLVLEGHRRGNRIVLEGETTTAAGKHRVRAFWEPQDGDVREIASTSSDGGKTWTPLFDIVFRKHRR